MELKQAIIVVADISGYTNFIKLHTMSLLHAEKIVTELMESIIDATTAPLKLNKLQGDAIMFYAEEGEASDGIAQEVIQQVGRFSDAFTSRSSELTGCNNMCPCDACSQASQLRLKTIVHNGEIAVKQVRGFEELAGEPVILAHRLLKNSLSSSEYILMTKSFSDLSDGYEGKVTESRSETYDDVGKVDFEVFYPDPSLNSNPVNRSIAKTLFNAWSLDLYALLRVLGLKKPPASAVVNESVKPGLWSFIKDGIQGLVMLIRKK